MNGLYDRYKDDMLSNNTQANYCEQCKNCIYWGKSGTPWDNKYDKANCEKYPYPQSIKPVDIINNRMPCPRRKVNG